MNALATEIPDDNREVLSSLLNIHQEFGINQYEK